MNYSGNTGSNPPWARQSGSGSFNFNAGNPFSGQPHLTQPALTLPTSLSGAVSAASNLSARTANQQLATGSNPNPRVFTGTITKVSDNFGFVDEDVFFQMSVCKGGTPKLGDRVLVEASFNANMPFKWNATRIQLIPNAGAAAVPQPPQPLRPPVAAVQQITALQQAHLTGSPITPVFRQGGLNIQQLQHMAAHQQHHHSHGRFGPSSHLNKPAPQQGRPSRFDQRDRRDERRERPRSPPRRRSRSPPPRRRSRSPKPKSRSRSPSRRKQRVAPRYSVTISPHSLDTKTCTVLNVRSRYSNMYIPSDFFHLSMDWVSAFPLHRTFPLGNTTKFHICNKEVAPLQPFPESVDPADADYSYSAKVMLLTQPSIDEIYKMCCSLTEDEKEGDFIHPARVLQFLVGMRSKNEPMAIGGPWSPSLDGADPAGDPRVLINTAIRTTKALTGIDLSACTQWYRFVDISYLRAEEVRKSKTIPEHTEHVVMFLPDVCSVVPTMMDYLSLQASYKHSLLVQLGLEEPVKQLPEESSSQADTEATADETSQSQTTVDDEETTADVSAAKPEPSHWSKLDPKSMKVVDLRTELEARGVSCKGLKTQLQNKLSKLLTVEMEKEEEGESQTATVEVKEEVKEVEKAVESAQEEVVEPVVELSEEEKAKKEKEMEKMKAQLEKHYVFPEEPVILVHPNRSAKSGKFDCSVMSLSVLLDYRPEDNKEHSFEVSLFAESFNEMLMRDFGFTIYKKVSSVPAKEQQVNDSAAADKQEASKAAEEDKSNSKNEESKDNKDDKVKSGTKRKRSAEPEPAKKRKEEDDDDDRSSMSSGTADRSEKGSSASKKKEADKHKLVTVDRAALLAFVYYDTTHTGYLVDKDLEDMIYTLGLAVSRAQARTLIQRVCDGKDSLSYRKLTDKPEGQLESSDEKVDEDRLAQGNMMQLIGSEGASAKKIVSSDGVVMYKGAIVEVEKVMSKLEKSETSRIVVEKELRIVQEERDSLKGKLLRSEERNRKLASDLKKTSDKLVLTKSEKNKKEEKISGLRDILTTTSKDLHAVVRLVDGCMAEVKDTVNGDEQELAQGKPVSNEEGMEESAAKIKAADSISSEIKSEAI